MVGVSDILLIQKLVSASLLILFVAGKSLRNCYLAAIFRDSFRTRKMKASNQQCAYRCIVKTSGFTRGVCKNLGFY